jgi:hypothetical protein
MQMPMMQMWMIGAWPFPRLPVLSAPFSAGKLDRRRPVGLLYVGGVRLCFDKARPIPRCSALRSVPQNRLFLQEFQRRRFLQRGLRRAEALGVAALRRGRMRLLQAGAEFAAPRDDAAAEPSLARFHVGEG